ncbi:MAG: DUF4167 domain-containing protein [Rhodobacteraceae bacterium CG17_big_fil_post_rev_8_21_14_2_50_63_15]|nr:DUF4167 domain-containing protein [Roseovarius sp.]PIV78614.1 MAG: DUF4167 domain-containing protein [Rhodobacteraceae bacterium CG17_big_fil_post_rev_8_21_14_2_50_63_15]
MRSSKSRQRNKPNRNRSVGNVVNRVFDSSGPEGKVRGTPQQIIEKYNQLARDAQLSGDRVATENFQQHAEHYLRMLGEAMKEQELRREEQERQIRDQNRDRQGDRERSERPERQPYRERDLPETGILFDPAEAPQPDVIDRRVEADSFLVETSESEEAQPSAAPKRPRKPRAKRPPKADEQQGQAEGVRADAAPSGSAEAAE